MSKKNSRKVNVIVYVLIFILVGSLLLSFFIPDNNVATGNDTTTNNSTTTNPSTDDSTTTTSKEFKIVSGNFDFAENSQTLDLVSGIIVVNNSIKNVYVGVENYSFQYLEFSQEKNNGENYVVNVQPFTDILNTIVSEDTNFEVKIYVEYNNMSYFVGTYNVTVLKYVASMTTNFSQFDVGSEFSNSLSLSFAEEKYALSGGFNTVRSSRSTDIAYGSVKEENGIKYLSFDTSGKETARLTSYILFDFCESIEAGTFVSLSITYRLTGNGTNGTYVGQNMSKGFFVRSGNYDERGYFHEFTADDSIIFDDSTGTSPSTGWQTFSCILFSDFDIDFVSFYLYTSVGDCLDISEVSLEVC